jgi:molecular chaperone HtpG
MSATTTAEVVEPQKLQFKTELKQLLDLIIHSLYTKKEIFLRELISNAADAIDKLRFQGLQQPELLEGNSDWQIRLIPDEKAKTLTVRDNGIGMSRDQIVEHLGTIAKSGTKAFLENLKQAEAKDQPELIGQFGVGFYASFMAADKVTVISQPAGGSEAVRWESDGQGEYTVAPAERPEGRGTDVVLHLRDDATEFLQTWRLKEIVKRYSDFIEHPVLLAEVVPVYDDKDEGDKDAEGDEKKEPKTETKDSTLNSRQAIWLRPKSEVKPEDANAFYKQLSHDYEDPAKTIHISAEGGAVEFKALLFVPAKRGMDWMAGPEKKSGVDLYVRRVLIQHECEEVAPAYLRFVKGVVDCADIPLNVSRETLQHNPVLAKVKTSVVNRVLKTLEEWKAEAFDAYGKFFEDFGAYLKEGAAQDWSNKQRLSDLLLFQSTATKPGEFTTFEKYVAGMKGDQKEIHYLIGESRQLLENSPYLEAFKARGEEVLLLTEPIDEFLASSLHSYKDKPLKAADRGEVKTAEETDEQKQAAEKVKPLLAALKEKLGADVADVRLSRRLKESAAVLVADEGAMSAHMERLMARMGRSGEVPPSKRVLELNPDHPAVTALRALQEKDANDPRVESMGRLLYDQAVIAEGSRVADPAAFAKRLNDLIARAAT